MDLEVGGSIPLSHPNFLELFIIAPGLQFQVNSPVNTMTQKFEAGRSPTGPIPNRQPYPPPGTPAGAARMRVPFNDRMTSPSFFEQFVVRVLHLIQGGITINRW